MKLFGETKDEKTEAKEKVRQPEPGETKNVRQSIIVDEDYLDFIRGKPCIVQATNCLGPIDPDHLQARGTGQHKRNDYTALSLCRKHHSERGLKGNEKFEALYNINLWREVSFLLMEYLMAKIAAQLPLMNALETGKAMRAAQRAYFKSKKQDQLVDAKLLEVAFDSRLNELVK